MSQDDYGMGGSMVSYKQKERINRDLQEFERSLQNKKKRKKKKHQQAKPMISDNTTELDESLNFSYTYLLNRLFSQLHLNPDHGGKKGNPVPEPKVGLVGSRKTVFANIQPICRFLHRDPNHLKKFIETELITTTNFNGLKQLILTGRWTTKHIKSVLREYIKNYILCENCSSLDTNLKRNNTTRLFDLKCNKCQSQRCCKRIEKAFKTIANRRQRIQQRQNENQRS